MRVIDGFKVLTFSGLMAGSLASAAAEQVPLRQDIKDWTVACDNTRQCTAINGTAETFSIRLIREAGPEGKVQLSLFSYLTPRSAPELDGHALKAVLTQSRTYGEEGISDSPERWTASGDQALALINELRNGTQLAFATDAAELGSSLSGLSAALLLIDSVQGRLGSQGAFVRRGPQPDSVVVPPAPAMPTLPIFRKPAPLSQADSVRIANAVATATRSDWQTTPDDSDPPVIKTYPLTDSTALVYINTPCGLNCAYWIYQAPRAHPGQAQPVKLDIPPFNDEESATVGGAQYQPDSGVLTISQTGGGMGGGMVTEWQFDGERFKVRRFAQLTRTAGIAQENWPVLFRAGR